MTAQDSSFDTLTALEVAVSTSAFSSPANLPYDLNGSVHSSSYMGTVSPRDLLISEPCMSAPNSSVFTALTSPSTFNESPEFNSCEVSPNFGSNDYESGEAWFPLFPEETPNRIAQTEAHPSPAQSLNLEATWEPARRRRSSKTSSPTARHSSVTGVNARRRDKPLPPIVVTDPSDPVAMKRARNTLAARKSRERKAARVDELEAQIRQLEAERDHWKRVAIAHGAQI